MYREPSAVETQGGWGAFWVLIQLSITITQHHKSSVMIHPSSRNMVGTKYSFNGMTGRHITLIASVHTRKYYFGSAHCPFLRVALICIYWCVVQIIKRMSSVTGTILVVKSGPILSKSVTLLCWSLRYH